MPSLPSTPSVEPVRYGIWVTCMAVVVVKAAPDTLIAVVAASTLVLEMTLRYAAASPVLLSPRSVPVPTLT